LHEWPAFSPRVKADDYVTAAFFVLQARRVKIKITEWT
jgi:hypothetical protein